MSETVNDYTAILAYHDNANLRWNAFTDLGTSVVLTYSFLETEDLPDGSRGYYGVDDFATFTQSQRESMRGVIEKAGEVAGIIFVEVDDGPSMINLYSGLDSDGGGITASGYANYGQGLLNYTSASDLVMIYQDFTPGTFTYQVLLHELGHSLGLSHTHQGEVVLDDHADHNHNSVMTYTYSFDHQEEYGLFDEQALTHLYGTAGSVEDFTTKVTGKGAIIITASDRDDRLIGTEEGSKLVGLGGDDTLYGREGEDILRGGNGRDMLQGGLGDDDLAGQKSNDTIYGDIGDQAHGGDDMIVGGLGADALFGQGGRDEIHGNIGGDTIDGGYGGDRLVGGKGYDRLIGADGYDKLTGGQGRDTFVFTIRDIGDRDYITDFEVGHDYLDLSDLTYVTQGNLRIGQVGTATEIYSYTYSLYIMLENFDHDDLDFADFIFADSA